MNRLVWPKYLVILCSHSVRRLIKSMKKSLIIYTKKVLTRTFSYSLFDECDLCQTEVAIGLYTE